MKPQEIKEGEHEQILERAAASIWRRHPGWRAPGCLLPDISQSC